MNSYSEYRESGIEWIGEIPLGWDVKKIKHGFYVKGRIGWKGLKSSEFLSEGFSYLVTGTDFKDGKIDWKGCYHIDKDRYEEDPYIQLHEDDLLITKDGSIGKLAVVDELDKPACLNSGIFVVRSINGDFTTKYLYWVLMSNIFTQFNGYTSYGSTIQHLYQNIFVEFSFGFPTIEEQILISNYLDKKTSQIDSLIEKIQQKIELLKEQRSSLINQSVTKGLNRDVKMKDSGVEWIGEIPTHWNSKKLSYVVHIMESGKRERGGGNLDGGIYSIGGEHITDDGSLVLINPKFVSEDFFNSMNSGKIEEGDILLVKDGATIGKTTIVDQVKKPMAINEHVFRLKVKENFSNKFFYYIFCCIGFKDEICNMAKTSVIPGLTLNFKNEIQVCSPPLREQTLISKYLDKKISQIDSLVGKETKRIELFKEYRQSLISSVVTGKMRITEEMI